MKKAIILAICLISIAATVSAQRYYPPRRRYYPQRREQRRQPADPDFNGPRFGLVGGVNFANVIDPNDPNFTTNTHTGVHAGVSLDVPIAFPFIFETELLYSQKGYTAFTPYGQFTQKSDFIDLPLLLKLKLARNFSFVIGPQVSFLTSTQNVYDNGFVTTVQTQYNQDYQGYNKTLLDGVLGIGINLNQNVELRGRYTIDLQSNASYAASNNPQYNNQVWQIGLAFKF